MSSAELADITVEVSEGGTISESKGIKVRKYTVTIKDKGNEICNIEIPLFMTFDETTKTYSILTKNKITPIETNIIPDDNLSVFVPSVLGDLVDDNILCDIPIYIYKKRHIGQNKRMYAVADVKINNKGEISEHNPTLIFYIIRG